MPSVTMYSSQPTTITQFSGCTLRREDVLEVAEESQRDDLDGHHLEQRLLERGGHRRSQARRAPSRMRTPPVTRSSEAFTRGRVSTAPRRSTNHAYAVSQTSPIAMWIDARSRM